MIQKGVYVGEQTNSRTQVWFREQVNSSDFDLTAIEMYQRKVGRPFSGVMGDGEIQAALRSGQIVIDPFDPDLLQSSSYDVRLGGWFYSAERLGHRVDFSPYAESEVREYYSGPHKAISHKQWCSDHQRQPFKGIGEDELVIVLAPGECILGHTVEYIGAAYGATTMMKARSSLGRINISTCDDAGWGDVGYINRWTMEIRNKNQDVWVPLVVGMPIGQLIFLWVAGSTKDYSDGGHYQSGVDVKSLKQSWKPESMLPRIWSPKNTEIRSRLLKNSKQVF